MSSADKLGARGSVLCLFSSMILFRQADINQHPCSSNIISSCPSLLTSLRLNLILKKKYTSYEWGKKRNWPCCIFSQYFVTLLTHIYKEKNSFSERERERESSNKTFWYAASFSTLKMVQSPKSEITSVLIHEKFTSKQKEVRREASLLHNPVKSMPSKWSFSDSVHPNQH